MKPPLILLLSLLLPGAAFGQVTVTRTDPVVERKTFDVNNRSAEMPRLSPNEAAVTQSFFGADTRIGGEIVERKQLESGQYEVKIKVDMVRMTLQLKATIWLPKNTTPKLTKHEEGHRLLAEHYYKDAQAIARALADEMMGQTISGKGPDPNTAADNALKEAAQVLGGRYLGKTDVPCGTAQEHYDRITAHGTNAVAEERAMAESIRLEQMASVRPSYPSQP